MEHLGTSPSGRYRMGRYGYVVDEDWRPEKSDSHGLLAIFDASFGRMANQLVDSALPSTREYWRKKFFGATDIEAADPRPFIEVLASRTKDATHADK